jgi:hypothetical protein
MIFTHKNRQKEERISPQRRRGHRDTKAKNISHRFSQMNTDKKYFMIGETVTAIKTC